MKIIKFIKMFQIPILNIKKEFKKRFNIDAEKITERKLRTCKVYITHEFEAENYAKIYVLIDGVETPEVDEILEMYAAALTMSAGKVIYYEVISKRI